jgi:transcriptional regulator with XRE-family HTH domain
MSIASEIKAARAQKGWSQRELARRMKVAPSAVAQWEMDGTRPTVKNRVDLSKMFGIPFIKLLPEISAVKGLSSDDQELLATVQQLLELPSPVRQGLLMTAAATAEAIRNQSPPR